MQAARWLFGWVTEEQEPSLEEWESQNLYLIPRSSSRPEPSELPAPLEVSHAIAVLPQTRPRLPALHNAFQSTYGRFGKSTPPRLPPAIEHHEEESAAMQEREEGLNRGLKRVLSSSGALSEPKRRSLDADERPPAARKPPPHSRLRSCSDSAGRQWQLRTVHMQRCASEGDDRYRSIESRHATNNIEEQLPSGEAARVNSSPELQLLLDDTVQLLQPPLLGPPGPGIAAIQEAGVATVRALSDSLAAVVAAADGGMLEMCASPTLPAATASAEPYAAVATQS